MHDMGAPRILGSTTLRLEVPGMEEFGIHEKLRLEQEVLGFSVTRNEMDLYGDIVTSLGVVPGHALTEYAGRKVTVAGVIAAGRRHLAKEGEWMLFISLQDSGGLIEVVLFPEAYKEHGALIANNGYGPYLVTGTVQVAGKGRGIGVQPPAGLRPSDAVVLKTHPVVIAEKLEPLDWTRELRSA
jgi:DNA polymerase III alpha subunit